MIRVSIRVHPGASRDQLRATEEGAMEAWLRARPMENKANDALVRVLAERLAVPRSEVRLVRGQRGRMKLVELPIESFDALVTRLGGDGA